MNRRRFLGLLGLAAAVAAVDPDALLWEPGKTTHILPPADGWNWKIERILPSPDLKFHPDAFHFMLDQIEFGPNELVPLNGPDLIKEAAKHLADQIDAEAMRLYDRETGISMRFIKAWEPRRDQLQADAAMVYGYRTVRIVQPRYLGTIRG